MNKIQAGAIELCSSQVSRPLTHKRRVLDSKIVVRDNAKQRVLGLMIDNKQYFPPLFPPIEPGSAKAASRTLVFLLSGIESQF